MRMSLLRLLVQFNLYKIHTQGTTQRWSIWTVIRLVKHSYEMTTNQSGRLE